MKQKPRWTLEMLTAALAVLCALLVLVLLVQRPAIWPVLVVLAVLWFALFGVFRYRVYKNPILFADYSDPDVIRVGDTYYMTASSFNYVPGLPILTSKDLVNWELKNYAIEKIDEPGYDLPQHAKGVSSYRVLRLRLNASADVCK